MAGPRITIMGGGSRQWVPVLVADIVNTPALVDAELVLMDRDGASSPPSAAYAQHVARIKGIGLTVRTTTDREAALGGTEFVVVPISTGGFDSMGLDLEVSARHGVRLPVGDTELLRRLGVHPAADATHTAEFFAGFLTTEADWGARWGLRFTTIEQRIEGERRYEEVFAAKTAARELVALRDDLLHETAAWLPQFA